MGYHIYHTDGIILYSGAMGESNQYFFIVTKNFGSIYAVAQGVRELKSKLRYSLQDFCRARFELVRGKGMWRITNAESLASNKNVFENIEKSRMISRIAVLLRRLIQGEEENLLLYDTVEDMVSFVSNAKSSDENMLYMIEPVVCLKIFSALGYGTENGYINSFIHKPLGGISVEEISERHRVLTHEVNRALKETHL